MLNRVTGTEKNKVLVGEILVEFCIIEQCIKSIVFDVYGAVPGRNNRETFDAFYYHIDNRVNGQCKSTDKIFKNKNNHNIHLQKLIDEISKLRNIAAHQTDALIGGWSKLPDNETLMKRKVSSKKIEHIRSESTILFEDDYKIIITKGRGWASLSGNTYIGSVEDLHNDWEFYSNQFNKIYQIWNDRCFEIFDIDGTQIAEY